mmetsp:Transcript_123284/g.343278  ORF Transcript_123284/g.343278 Transcript_123284/m.343278 type:complete len:239 (-) Transcript_123284:467-1183(-)
MPSLMERRRASMSANAGSGTLGVERCTAQDILAERTRRRGGRLRGDSVGEGSWAVSCALSIESCCFSVLLPWSAKPPERRGGRCARTGRGRAPEPGRSSRGTCSFGCSSPPREQPPPRTPGAEGTSAGSGSRSPPRLADAPSKAPTSPSMRFNLSTSWLSTEDPCQRASPVPATSPALTTGPMNERTNGESSPLRPKLRSIAANRAACRAKSALKPCTTARGLEGIRSSPTEACAEAS